MSANEINTYQRIGEKILKIKTSTFHYNQLPSLSYSLKKGFRWQISEPINKKLRCSNRSCGCRLHNFTWINHKEKLIYYEVPKSASTSFRTSLNLRYSILERLSAFLFALDQHQENLFVIKDTPLVYRTLLIQYLDFLCTKPISHNLKLRKTNQWSTYLSPLTNTQGYETMAIVRNPLERFLSNWKMFTSKPNHKSWLQSQLSCDVAELSIESYLKLIQGNISNHHWSQQVDYLPLDTNRQPIVNHIVKLESIGTSDKVLEKYLPGSLQLPHRNKATSKKRQLNLSTETIKLLKDIYKKDFQLLYPELI